MKTIYIIGCGAQKRAVKSPAAELYTGPYFRACLRYARSKAADTDIYILSAKHGLLSLTDEIEPYDQRMTMRRAVSMISIVQQQVLERELSDCEVVAVCGGDYRRFVAAAFHKEPTAPLRWCGGIGNGIGIGKQLAWLKANTEAATR